MSDAGLKNELGVLINRSLDKAEAIWSKSKGKLETFDSLSIRDGISFDSVESNIPGYPFLFEGQNDVSEFIAFVVDMRKSTEHLKTIKTSHKVNQLQRVYYETSALLPALDKAIESEGGKVTEYLGDGVLALFKVDENNKKETLYAARRAAISCILLVRPIVNEILLERYNLPELDIGVGMSISKAIVLLVGLPNYQHPKIIGDCVYTATKLACEVNRILVDDRIKNMWPSAQNGSISFQRKEARGGQAGYLLPVT